MTKFKLMFIFMVWFGCSNAWADQLRVTINHGGIARSYLLYLPPSYQKGEAMPLVMALHGRPSNAQRMADLTSFNSRADQNQFIVVYPEGLEQYWDYLHGYSGYQERSNDSDFLIEVVEDIEERFSVDSGRIYVAGISNGGFMTQRLACYAPQKFSAFASVAAGGFAGMPLECVSGVPVNMLYIHGTADTKLPWNGLSVKDTNGHLQPVTMSILDSVKFWADRNHCSPEVTRMELPQKNNTALSRVSSFSSKNCDRNGEVVLYAIMGGGHNWPGVPDFIPASIAGTVNEDIHASDVIWSFFSSKRRD